MTNKVFISYRREDSQYQAGRIYEAFVRALPPDTVFMDVDSMAPGDDFVEALEGWVQQCDVLLALIGPRWIDSIDPRTNLRRLDNPEDFVRIEVRGALARKIPVVPVLLDAAKMPAAAELPDDINTLPRRNAEFVDFRTFDADVQRLIKRLKIGEKIELPGEAPGPQAADDRRRTAGLDTFFQRIKPEIVAARKPLLVAAMAALPFLVVLPVAYLITAWPHADAPAGSADFARSEEDRRAAEAAASAAATARIQAEAARQDAEARLNEATDALKKSEKARQEAEARVAGLFLAGIGSSSNWVLDRTANCRKRDQNYYSMTSSADTITWTNGSGDVDVEAITSTGNDEFRTRTQKSQHVNSEENAAIGTTWIFSRAEERMRVQSSVGNDYYLARCS
jgi:hypothetical protein